jgi:hypothetical protein
VGGARVGGVRVGGAAQPVARAASVKLIVLYTIKLAFVPRARRRGRRGERGGRGGRGARGGPVGRGAPARGLCPPP